MKTFLLIVVCIGLIGSSICFAEETITEESIQTFLAVYPRQMAIYGKLLKGTAEQEDAKEDFTRGYIEKLEDLLEKYDLDLAKWSRMKGRIMAGYAIISMQNAGMSSMRKEITLMSPSDEELALIKKYLSKIKRALEAGASRQSKNMR